MTRGQRLWLGWSLAALAVGGIVALCVTADSEKDLVSRCKRCGVTQYRWYYCWTVFGTRIRLPVNLDTSGRDDPDCAHDIEFYHRLEW